MVPDRWLRNELLKSWNIAEKMLWFFANTLESQEHFITFATNHWCKYSDQNFSYLLMNFDLFSNSLIKIFSFVNFKGLFIISLDYQRCNLILAKLEIQKLHWLLLTSAFLFCLDSFTAASALWWTSFYMDYLND